MSGARGAAESAGSALGALPDFLRASLRRLTWRGFWTAEALGMLAVYFADEAVVRGKSAWRAYLIALTGMSMGFVAFQEGARQVFALPMEGPSTRASINQWLAIGDDFAFVFGVGGVAMLAYYNRRRVERMLEGLRVTELRRVRLERELIASRLEAAQAEVDPASLFGRLAGIRSLYGSMPAEADSALGQLIEELRAKRDLRGSGSGQHPPA